jgi:hypothetical protein
MKPSDEFYEHCLSQMTHVPEKANNLVIDCHLHTVRSAFAERIAQFSFNAGALAGFDCLSKEDCYDCTPAIMVAFMNGDYQQSAHLMVLAGRFILENVNMTRIARQRQIEDLEKLGGATN